MCKFSGIRQVSTEICRSSTSEEELNRMLALYEREEFPPDVNINLELDLHHASVHEHSSSVHLMADLYMVSKFNIFEKVL